MQPASPCPAKVLWVSCVGEKGGAEVYLLNFVRHLDPSRYTAAVALLRDGPFAAELRSAGITVHVLRRHRMRNLPAVGEAIVRLAILVHRHGYRIVHSNCFRGHVYGGLAARLAGVPEVWSVHTPERPGPSTSLIEAIPTRHITANCPRTADYFRSRRHPVGMIWPGVDLRLPPQLPSRTEIAARHGLPPGCRWVAMAARMQRYKGQEHLIRALAGLSAHHADVHAVIIGGALFEMETNLIEELRGLAAELGVADRVHLPGFVSDADLRALVAGSEFMVHPALDEDFGLIVAESQAAGKAVVAYASVGPAAIVGHGTTGLLVPVGDQGGLSRALEDLLGDPDRAAAFGRAGAGRVDRLFAAPEASRKLQLVYDACLRGETVWREPWTATATGTPPDAGAVPSVPSRSSA